MQVAKFSRLKLKPSLDWLLIFVPLAVLLRFWPGGISPTALFVCSALGIIPVAGWIGRATEALASHVGTGLGGLLTATFRNAAESPTQSHLIFLAPGILSAYGRGWSPSSPS